MNVFVLCTVINNTVWFLEKEGDIYRLTKEMEDALGFYTREKAQEILNQLLDYNEEFSEFFSRLEVKDFLYYENQGNLTH